MPVFNGIPQPEVPQTDMMANLLTEIFGEGWSTMNLDGSSSAGAAAYNMLYPMLTHMNQIALTLVTILVFVTMVTGVAGTAHEGKALGRRFNEMWVPARMLLGVTGLAPVANGLCIFQLFILWGAGWSIDFANQMAGEAVSYLTSSRGQIITTMPTSMRESAHSLAEASLRTALVQTYYHHRVYGDSQYGDMISISKAMPLGQDKGYVVRIQFIAPKNSDLTNTDLGAVYIYGETPDDPIMWSKVYAVENIHADMVDVASDIVLVQPVRFDGIDRAVHDYERWMKPVLGQMIANSNQELNTYIQNFGETLRENGWISLGMFHWTIVRTHEKAMATVMTGFPSFVEPNWNKINLCSPSDIGFYLTNNWAYYCDNAKTYKQDALDRAKEIAAGPDAHDHNALGEAINYVYRDISLPGVVNLMTEGGPVTAMSNLGHQIIFGINTAVTVYVLSRSVAAAADTSLDSGVGKIVNWAAGGGLLKGATRFSLEALQCIAVPFFLCLIPLYTLAYTMAYYLPALPMIIWVSGCIGWILQVIEALVAAPIWVAAHTHPDGEGITGKFGGHGYIRLLAIILKPALLVVGFSCALVIEHMVGPYLAKALLVADASMNGSRVTGVSTLIAMTFLCGMIVLIMTHKIFSLCVFLPDHVLNWIGSHADALGEMEAERHAASSYGAVGTKAEGVAQGTLRAGGKGTSPGVNIKNSDLNSM